MTTPRARVAARAARERDDVEDGGALGGATTTARARGHGNRSPRSMATHGFGQPTRRTPWGARLRATLGMDGRKTGERTRDGRRGRGRGRGDAREDEEDGDGSKGRRDGRREAERTSRLWWVCAAVLVWTFGPFAYKCAQGFNKVYGRRWFDPVERPVPCEPTSAAAAKLVDNSPLPGLLPADMTNLPSLLPKKFKIGMISLCDDGVEAICAQSMANKQAYADYHGYDLIVDEEIIDRNRPTSWSKLLAMRKYLPDYDFMLYVDVDTIIMNPEKKLEDIVDYNYDQMLAADKNGLNCGVWMVRNTPWMLWFIDEMWAQDQLVAPKTWNMLFKYEQRAFHYLYQSKIWRSKVKGDAYPKANTVRARTKVLNACVFNSQPSFYVKGDLLVHLAGLKGTVKCMWFRYYYKQSLNTIRAVGAVSSDADLPPPSIWTCLTRQT